MKKIAINDDKFKLLVSSLCRNIVISNWTPDYVVGITRGGLIPAVMISHYFNIPCHTLPVSLRDHPENCETNCWMAEDAFGYELDKMNILIVDDINDTGSTINWIQADWQSSCLPNDPEWSNVWGHNVRYAVIVDNLSSLASLPPTYSAMEINKAEEDVWIDFPFEHWWRG